MSDRKITTLTNDETTDEDHDRPQTKIMKRYTPWHHDPTVIHFAPREASRG